MIDPSHEPNAPAPPATEVVVTPGSTTTMAAPGTSTTVQTGKSSKTGIPSSQMIILGAVIIGWAFSLVMFYIYKVVVAQPIADGGWAALLMAFRSEFTQTVVNAGGG